MTIKYQKYESVKGQFHGHQLAFVLFASGAAGNAGFVAVVVIDEDEVGILGATTGLIGSFFTVLSVFIFKEAAPGACEDSDGFFPEAWLATMALVVDPLKTAFLLDGRGTGETLPPPPRLRDDESRLCGGMGGTTILDSPTSFIRASNPASWYSRNREWQSNRSLILIRCSTFPRWQ